MPECIFWNNNLKPCAFTRNTSLFELKTGNGKDLLGEEETQTGVLEILALEYFLFGICRDTGSIIFTDNDKAMR